MQINANNGFLKMILNYKIAAYTRIELVGGKIVIFISYSCVRYFYEKICFTYRCW